MSEATARIRQAIHDGPSRDEFIRIARAFERLLPDEVPAMLAFAGKHLEAWPAEVRVAPQVWWRRVAGGAEVPAFRFVRWLELDAPGGGVEVARAIAGSPPARQLLGLSIANEPIGDEGAAVLAGSERLVQLEALRLIAAGIGPRGVLALVQGRLRPLARLDLSGNALTPEALEASLRMVAEGGTLSLARAELGAEGARALAAAERSRKLSSIDLSGNDAGDAGAGALSACGWLGHLEELSFADNGITSRGMRALSQASWLSSLSALDLSGNQLGDEGFAMLWPRLTSIAELSVARTGIGADDLLELLGRVRLAELDASGNRLSPEALARMNGIRRLTLREVDLPASEIGHLMSPELERLDLSGNMLTLAGVAIIAGSPAALDRLDLSGTGLGDAGLALLAGGRAMTTLRSLGLQNDGITPDGLSALLGSERTIRLSQIDLSGNPLGPDGARRLAESKLIGRLTRIHVRNCGLTRDWIETLQAAAPLVAIED